MLWRANLYLEKTDEHELSDIDWNNAHPWNAPASGTEGPDWWDKGVYASSALRWGYNEWNRVYDAKSGEAKELEDLTPGEGGQVIDICSWTRFNGGSETSSVAYSWGCWDSAFNFNFELQGQRKAIEKRRESDPVYASKSWNGSTEQVYAPGGDWKNYIFKEMYKAETGELHTGSNLTAEEKASFAEQPPYSVSSGGPSVPGLSSWVDTVLNLYTGKRELPKDNPEDEPKYETTYSNTAASSSGTDCSGLATRVINYAGNKYTAAINEKLATGGFADTDNTIPIFAASTAKPWKIQDEGADECATQRALLSHAVPGDILVKAGYHVVIIQDLTYSDTMQITDYSQVDVIHSTRGGLGQTNLWNVQKGTWFDLGSDTNYGKQNYQLRRLSVKEN